MAKTFTVELKNGRILKNVTEKQAEIYQMIGANVSEVGKKPPELSIPREITNPIKLKGPEPIISKPEVKEGEVKAQVKEIDLDAKPEIPFLEAEEETEEKAKPKPRAKRTKK